MVCNNFFFGGGAELDFLKTIEKEMEAEFILVIDYLLNLNMFLTLFSLQWNN